VKLQLAAYKLDYFLPSGVKVPRAKTKIIITIIILLLIIITIKNDYFRLLRVEALT